MSFLVLAMLAATPGFEGELQMRLNTQMGDGQVTLTLSPRGLRSDLEGAFMKQVFKTSMVVKASEPAIGVSLDPVRKTFQRFDLAQASEAMRPQQSKSWRVEKLGVSKVLDFPCEHVRVDDGQGFVAEYWVSTQMVKDPTLAGIVNRAAKQPASVESELQRVGVRGLVLKMEQENGADRISLELTRASSKVVGAAVFEVPADYQPTGSAIGPGASVQQLAAFNSLTAEQKQALSQKLRQNFEATRPAK